MSMENSSQESLTTELSYLSGCIFAQEVFMTHLAKMFAIAGFTTEGALHEMLRQMSVAYFDDDEFGAGYQETLEKLREGLTDIR